MPTISLQIFLCLSALALVLPRAAHAENIAMPGSQEKLQQETIERVRSAVGRQLTRYCSESCEVVGINVEMREDVSESAELGFEALTRKTNEAKAYVNKISLEVQVDERVTKNNRERLQEILMNHLRSISSNAEVLWHPVRLPNIGVVSGTADFLRGKLEEKIASTVNGIIQKYCPNTCILGFVSAAGNLISLDEAQLFPRAQQFRSDNGDSVLGVEKVNIELTMDEKLNPALRDRIAEIIRAQTRFVSPVNLNMSLGAFPETYAEAQGITEDPYGLEKLRRTLEMFRELASTKEIISKETRETSSSATNNSSNETKSDSVNSTNSNNTSASTNSSDINTKSELSEKSRSAQIDSSSTSEQATGVDDYALWGSFALVAILVLFLILRYTQAQKDAKMMVASADMASMNGGGGQGRSAGGAPMYNERGEMVNVNLGGSGTGGGPQDYQELALRLKVESLKDELSKQFLREPKVAKHTFSRMLKEDGVEYTAKFLHIFGHMIVLELLDDPNVTRDLYALSEYFSKTKIDLTLFDEYELLKALKAKQTSSEIRVRSERSSTQFEFLHRLDPIQIHNLIAEEKAQVQSIVLTQLDRKRRMSVFDMYQGKAKVELMGELCRADAIPREYLNNVAKALNRKVRSRPEFDTENIRSSDIIIDLLERSQLVEQIQIMQSIKLKNPDTARGIMMKLVTVEVIPYLKDGHLLELVMGMEREDLITFLAGTRDHIRDLLLSKAPPELSESWQEDLMHVGGVDEQKLRLVEMSLFAKIRALADNGVISLLDINGMLFQLENPANFGDNQIGSMSSNAMVA